MTSKEALELLKNNVSDYLEAIKNNEPTIDKIELMCGCFYPLYETINQDLDKLESLKRFKKRSLEVTNKLYKENEELKSIIKELSEKIAKDSAEMSSMYSELHKLKGGFVPENFEG